MTTQTSYLFLAVGTNITLHNQVNYAILSLLSKITDSSEIWLITDAPQHYTQFNNAINCLPVSHETLSEWKGINNYFYRIKIKAMQHVFEKISGNLVFLDADIVCIKNLSDFEKKLNQGYFFMHMKEFLLCSGPTKTTRHMWKFGQNKSFGPALIDKNSFMWNSGVIGIPFGSFDHLEKALEACDAMCQSKMRPHYTEQLALGLVLGKTQKLLEAKEWFLHYWGNKKQWQQRLIDPFLSKIKNAPLSEAIQLMKENKHTLPLLRLKKQNFFKKNLNLLSQKIVRKLRLLLIQQASK